jgi:hypothetical protein
MNHPYWPEKSPNLGSTNGPYPRRNRDADGNPDRPDLAARGIATLRYQFPYMEKRGKRPDTPAVCHATVRATSLPNRLRSTR